MSDRYLDMEIRSLDTSERMLVGVVAPYDETTYLVRDPGGERIKRGAFAKSIRQKNDAKKKIPLLRNHRPDKLMGKHVVFEETPEGLVGTFAINDGKDGDKLLDQLRDGYYDGLSVGFQALGAPRGSDGVREIHEAMLMEVSVVGLPAYGGASLIGVGTRQAQLVQEDLLAPFKNPPVVNLEPIPRLW